MNIGTILVAWKVITEEQLRDAVRFQVTHPEDLLGEIIVRMGFATFEDVNLCLAKQEMLRAGSATVPDVERISDYLSKQNTLALRRIKDLKGG